MQGLTTMTVTVNDIPSELYDAKAQEKSLLDILQPGEVKQITINPAFFTNVTFQKGLSTDKNKVVSSGTQKRLGIIGLLKSWDITWDSKKVLMGFHGGWHPNNMPRWRRRQFNPQGVQTFYGHNTTDQVDWLLLQLHPQNRLDVVATMRVLKQKGIKEPKRKDLLDNAVLRHNWLFEFNDPGIAGEDYTAQWLKEQEVNKKIEAVLDGHLQILMSDVFRGYKFLNQPTLAKSTSGARAYLVNQTRLPGGYNKLRKVFNDLENAIEVDLIVGAIGSNKIKITEFEVLRPDNGKVYLKFEESIPTTENDEEKVLWIKTRMNQVDGYKEMVAYLDELAKASSKAARTAKV